MSVFFFSKIQFGFLKESVTSYNHYLVEYYESLGTILPTES